MVYTGVMSKSKSTTTKSPNAWTAEDRQAFADGNILRAKTIPNKRRESNRKACRKGRWD